MNVDVGSGERFVDRPAGRAFAFLSDAARGVALGVTIDKQHPLAVDSNGGGQIDRRSGLSDATFLICDGDNFSHVS